MPELPEVETTRRGIAPALEGQRITEVIIRQRRLRWPIPPELETVLTGQTVRTVQRRAKYLLINAGKGHALAHLGMSGSLRIVPAGWPVQKHDHVDIRLASGQALRYTDPRRFGALLWTADDPLLHPLLASLGPEPLSDAFTAEHLHRLAQGRRAPVKTFIMDGHVVVGVGNIYANEALFMAGISPLRAAGEVTLGRYEALVTAIRTVLSAAITQGGTTLRDYVGGHGDPGFFKQQLQVYDRAGGGCLRCQGTIQIKRVGQRSTYFCDRCQD